MRPVMSVGRLLEPAQMPVPTVEVVRAVRSGIPDGVGIEVWKRRAHRGWMDALARR